MEKYTHKGEWGSAVDFVPGGRERVRPSDMTSKSCEDFLCYKKPVGSRG